jgi:protein SCO1/2
MKIAMLLVLAACSRASTTPVPVQEAPTPVERAMAPSVYDLGVTLRDSHGNAIGLDAQRGKPVLLSMFYSSCTVACPALIDSLKTTLASVDRDDVRVMLVSFDPVRDTPDKLAALAHARSLDDRWTLASTDDPLVVAAAIGYRYRKLDNGEFFHSATIVLLDEEGRPVARSEGFNQREQLLAALR